MCELYILEGSTAIGHASLASQDFHDITKICRLKLEHISERASIKLVKQYFLKSEKLNQLEFYDHCILWKQDKVKFKWGVHSSNRLFKCVH